MNIFLNSIDYKSTPFSPIELQVSLGDALKDEIQFNPAQFKTLSQKKREICFEIDRAVSLDSNISIKMARKGSEKKTRGDVYKVLRGKIFSCRKFKSRQGLRFEVCVRILETVIQAEIQFSRLNKLNDFQTL